MAQEKERRQVHSEKTHGVFRKEKETLTNFYLVGFF